MTYIMLWLIFKKLVLVFKDSLLDLFLEPETHFEESMKFFKKSSEFFHQERQFINFGICCFIIPVILKSNRIYFLIVIRILFK